MEPTLNSSRFEKRRQPKAVLIRMWAGPPIARSIDSTLRQAFPEYELQVLDVAALLKRRPLTMLANSLATLWEYGLQILRRRKQFKESFYRTQYLFRRVKPLVRPYLLENGVRFSFQLQSMFDASQPGLPHFIYTDHTHLANLTYPGANPADLYSKGWIKLEKTAYQNARRIFTRSTNITRSLVEQYQIPPDKVACVYAGSNVNGGSPSAETALPDTGARVPGKEILFVGIDWERKGGPELLQAFKQVLNAHPDASLTIIGSRPEFDLPNVQALGRLPVSELSRFYRRADIFCLPTRMEPFGIVFVEALSYGMPLVATRVGAVPDLVIEDTNGCLVEVGDVDGLAKALIDLLDDPEKRRRFGQASLQLAQERYNWGAVGRKIRENVDAVMRK